METARLFAELERERATLAGGLAWEGPAEFVRRARSKLRVKRVVNAQVEGEPDGEEDDDLEVAGRRAALESLQESLARRTDQASPRELARLRRRVTDEAGRCGLRLRDLSALLGGLPPGTPRWTDLHLVYLRIQSVVESIVRSHLGLIERQLQDDSYTARGLDIDDLYQEGAIGLIVGVDKYKFRLGMPFSRYAMRGIFSRIERALTNDERLIRIPSGTLETIRRVRQHTSKLEREGNWNPTADELAAALDISPRRVVQVLEVARVFDSGHICLDDQQSSRPGSARTVGEGLLMDEAGPDDVVEVAELGGRVVSALALVKPQQQEVLRRRFGFEDGSEGWSHLQIGRAMNLTRQRIQQVEVAALERIREVLSKLPARIAAPVPSRDRVVAPPSALAPPRPRASPPRQLPTPKAVAPLPPGAAPESILDLNEASLIAFRNWVHREGRLKDSTAAMLTSVLRGARRILGGSTTAEAFARWGAAGAQGSNTSAACRHFLHFVVGTNRIPQTSGAPPTRLPGDTPPPPTEMYAGPSTDTTPEESNSGSLNLECPKPPDVDEVEADALLPSRPSSWQAPGGEARPAFAAPTSHHLVHDDDSHISGMLVRGLRSGPPTTRPAVMLLAKPNVVATSEVTRDALRSSIVRLLVTAQSGSAPARRVVPVCVSPTVVGPATVELTGDTEPDAISAIRDLLVVVPYSADHRSATAELGTGGARLYHPTKLGDRVAGSKGDGPSGRDAMFAKLGKAAPNRDVEIRLAGPIASNAAASIPELKPWLIGWLALNEVPPSSRPAMTAPPCPPAPTSGAASESCSTPPAISVAASSATVQNDGEVSGGSTVKVQPERARTMRPVLPRSFGVLGGGPRSVPDVSALAVPGSKVIQLLAAFFDRPES